MVHFHGFPTAISNFGSNAKWFKTPRLYYDPAIKCLTPLLTHSTVVDDVVRENFFLLQIFPPRFAASAQVCTVLQSKSPLVILSSNINCFGIDIVAAITEDVMIDCVGLVSHHFHVKEAFMPPALQWRNAFLKNAISTTESYLAKEI